MLLIICASVPGADDWFQVSDKPFQMGGSKLQTADGCKKSSAVAQKPKKHPPRSASVRPSDGPKEKNSVTDATATTGPGVSVGMAVLRTASETIAWPA